MKQKKNLCAIGFIICSFVGIAQTELPREFKVFTPDYLIETNNNRWARRHAFWQEYAMSEIKKNNFGRPQNRIAWVAYSDRANNTTFNSPNGARFGELEFMEKVYIADIKNGFALVFTDGQINTFPNINSSAVSKGWISVDNLLLWDRCPQNKNLIFEKGLIVGDPSKSTNIVQNPPFITSPSETGNHNGNANRLDILFIMKEEVRNGRTYYLLSKEMMMRGNGRVISGWLSEAYVTRWDQRLCLEPTTASQNFQFYRDLGVFPAIYQAQREGQDFFTSRQQGSPFWIYREFSQERMHARTMRAPIIDKTSNNDIFRVASIASIDGAGQKEEQKATDAEELERWKELNNNINVIFVIDATSSMRPYYPAVANALRNVIRTDWEGKNLNVAVVLYRNVADGNCEIEVERLLPMRQQSNQEKIINFISSAGTCGTRSDGRVHQESLFKGLETALDMRRMGYQSGHSNFMIVIGDAGNLNNDPEGRTVASIAKKMSDNRINLLAFQVNHGNSDAYDDFAIQMGQIIRGTVQNRNVTNIEYKLMNNRLYLAQRKNSNIPSLIYTGYKYALPGRSENVDALRNDIISNINDFKRLVDDRINVLSKTSDDGFSGDNSAEEVRLREILTEFGWSQQRINNYIRELKDGGVTKLIGYAPIKVRNAQHTLFDYVLFFSLDELRNLIHELRKLESGDHISNRKAYQDAVVAMGQAFLGQMTQEDIISMNMDELIGQIYGVPVAISNCGIKIEDIISPNRVSDARLRDYINDFNVKRRRLEQIRDNPNPGKFSSNGITYIWIRMSDMPGYCVE